MNPWTKNPWTNKRTAKLMAFYIINAAILLVVVTILLEVWGFLDPIVRDKTFTTIGTIIVGGLCFSTVNYFFSTLEDDYPTGDPPPTGGGLSRALREAKLSSDENSE